jgi:hypothetical protein
VAPAKEGKNEDNKHPVAPTKEDEEMDLECIDGMCYPKF